MKTALLLLLGGATLAARAAEPPTLGYIEPYHIVTVSAAESGIVAEMLVKEGDAVKKGQVLARLDTAVLAAELEIARAEAKLQGTRRQRIEDLAGSSAPPRTSWKKSARTRR